jgi:hypothetical protein
MWYGETEILLIRAQRVRGVRSEVVGAVRMAELLEESEAVEEVDGEGDTDRDDIATSASCVRCRW